MMPTSALSPWGRPENGTGSSKIRSKGACLEANVDTHEHAHELENAKRFIHLETLPYTAAVFWTWIPEGLLFGVCLGTAAWNHIRKVARGIIP